MADINISDLHVEAKKISAQQMPLIGGLVIAGQLIQPQEQYEVRIMTGHTVCDQDGKEKTYGLELGEESLGAKQLVFFAPLLRQTLENGKTVFIDELDRSLHPFIVKFLVNLFRDPKWNKNGAQLIFTTHDTTLLSLDTFRKDQIYFTEKDAKTGATDLYSLDEFSIRKTDNIEKGYLLGRYGAIPYLHTEELV
jgi:AAA15 family ATPase/GTPase